MFKKTSGQLEFEGFYLPFGGKLRDNNRWIVLAELVPWEIIEEKYSEKFDDTQMGAKAIPARVAIGSLIIKEKLGITDEETVMQIQENPYLQFFLGYGGFSNKRPFDPSMMVHFRKRFILEDLLELNETLCEKHQVENPVTIEKKENKNNSDDDDPPSNSGKLILDATCAPADITYPTDLKLLNDAREKSERIIDVLYEPLKGEIKKVRTYRENARRDYLRISKKRKVGRKAIRKAIGQQLSYLKRNLNHIKNLAKYSSLSLLTNIEYKNLLVIHEVYRQQNEMHRNRTNKIEYRIVSISQPHVRPIVRGKAGSPTEFGAKLSISVVDGFVFIERISWENYNESVDLTSQIELYKKRFGCYPESVHADQIYRTRKNLKYCKEHGIRFSGKALGRPRKTEDLSAAEKKKIKEQQKLDEGARNIVEAKFGQGKRRFGLNRIMAKRADTSEVAIAICFLVINLEKCLKDIFLLLVDMSLFIRYMVLKSIFISKLAFPGLRSVMARQF